MNLPVEMFPPVSCRYTHGEAILFMYLGIKIILYSNSQWKEMSQSYLYVYNFWLFIDFFFSLPRMDATLKELTSLVKEVYPEARKKGTHFSFNIVYPDPRGKMYRLVKYKNKIGSILRDQHLWMIYFHVSDLTLQIERHWQYCVWQKRYR